MDLLQKIVINITFLLNRLTLWSGNFFTGKVASLYNLTPFKLSFLRWSLAFLLLLPFTYRKIIEDLEKRHGDKNICSVLCMQSGSSIEMIESTWKKIKAQRPIIALTKSDECNLSASALSKLAELKGKIGLVSGTRSIVDSLLFTDANILTKFMKENF